MSTHHLRDARKAVGLTQTELADLVGKDQSWVSKLEAGAVRPDPDMAVRLAHALGLDVLVVIYGPDGPRAAAAYDIFGPAPTPAPTDEQKAA